MDRFDEELRARAQKEPFPVPEDLAGRVQRTFDTLEEADLPMKRRHRPYRWAGWAAAVLAVFVAVPNASPAAAAALADVPVLGTIVEIVTFRDYAYDDGQSHAAVTVPELSGSDAADEVSDQVQAYTDQLIEQFQADREAAGEGHVGLDVSSTVVTDSDTWFTLRIDAVETQGGAMNLSRLYHIDKATGEVVTLSGLFQADADYVGVLSAEVARQMEEKMAQDSSVVYFTDGFTAIDPEQDFYWDEDGDLVLVFGEYTLAPGYMGMQEFVIPQDVYSDMLA